MYLDAGPSSLTELNEKDSIERMVLPEMNKNTKDLRAKPELYQDSVDVISSLSEMKGEVRREIEVMNMKMTQLEQQVSTILDLLKSQGHLNSRASGSIHEAQTSTTDIFNKSIDSQESISPTSSPTKARQRRLKTPPRSPAAKEPGKTQDQDTLPDWLAPPSAASRHSIPDWEEGDSSQQNASSAARLLNDNGKSKKAADAKILQTLNFMKK